jgi:hypothetical protein
VKKSYPTEKQLAAKQEVRLYFTPDQMKVLQAMMFIDRKGSIEEWITHAIVSLVEGTGAYAGFHVGSTKRFLRANFGKSVTHRDFLRFLEQYPQHTDHPQELRKYLAERAPKGERPGTGAEEVGR